MRHPNYRIVKTHRSYTVEEVARLFSVHRNTVREWVKRGLPTCDDRRPILIVGRHLSEYLKARRLKNRHRCCPGELFCVRCRVPRRPAGGMVDYLPKSATLGNLVAICPICDALMHRGINPAKLEQIRGTLDVTLPEGLRHIDESSHTSVNRDLKGGTLR